MKKLIGKLIKLVFVVLVIYFLVNLVKNYLQDRETSEGGTKTYAEMSTEELIDDILESSQLLDIFLSSDSDETKVIDLLKEKSGAIKELLSRENAKEEISKKIENGKENVTDGLESEELSALLKYLEKKTGN